jgi:hypothetical protein
MALIILIGPTVLVIRLKSAPVTTSRPIMAAKFDLCPRFSNWNLHPVATRGGNMVQTNLVGKLELLPRSDIHYSVGSNGAKIPFFSGLKEKQLIHVAT